MGSVITDLRVFENGLNFLGLNLPPTSSDPIKDFWKLWWHSLTCFCLAAVLSPENSPVLWKLIPLHLKFLCHRIPKPPSVCQQFQVLIVSGLMKFQRTHSHSCDGSFAMTDRVWSGWYLVLLTGPVSPGASQLAASGTAVTFVVP